MTERRRVLVVTSSGGVMLDVLALEPWWRRHDTRWVAVRAPDSESVLAGEAVRWEREQSASSPLPLAAAILRARRDLSADRPDVIVSAGTGVAVAYFLVARVLRIPLIWIETFNMVGRPGLAARLCSALADRVLVQRPELLETRRRAFLVGELY